MVRVAGFEPAISWPQTRRNNQIIPYSGESYKTHYSQCSRLSFGMLLLVSFYLDKNHSSLKRQNEIPHLAKFCWFGEQDSNLYCYRRSVLPLNYLRLILQDSFKTKFQVCLNLLLESSKNKIRDTL